jgi:SAM-dependent methyltransferase
MSVTQQTRRRVPSLDWGLGRYEHTAQQLRPAARVLVNHARVERDERVVDVGCGTGNATLLAAARSTRVKGVDPAMRLLKVARGRAAARGLDVTFVHGEAASLPLADDSADVVLSSFGVIFAGDAIAAADELARVTAPKGRIVLSAWIPEGAIHEVGRAARQAITDVVGAPTGPPPFAWHDLDALTALLGPGGFEVSLQEATLAITAPSALEYLVTEHSSHPFAVVGRAILEPRGKLEALQARTLEILEGANEDPAAFRVTSRYVVATARRV